MKRDLNGTRERVKQALQHEDEPVPHKRRRRTHGEKSADGMNSMFITFSLLKFFFFEFLSMSFLMSSTYKSKLESHFLRNV